MGNAAWVCFDCREVVRRPTRYSVRVPCPKCGRDCRAIGNKTRVPAKRAIRAWRELRERYAAHCIRVKEILYRRRLRERHALEQEIRRLEARRPKNPGRAKAIRRLRRRLGGV